MIPILATSYGNLRAFLFVGPFLLIGLGAGFLCLCFRKWKYLGTCGWITFVLGLIFLASLLLGHTNDDQATTVVGVFGAIAGAAYIALGHWRHRSTQ